MTTPPDDPPPDVERVVDAIADGRPVDWGIATGDPEKLAALRLIDDVARLHRSGGAGGPELADAPAPGSAGADGGDRPASRSWGNLRILGSLGRGAYGEVFRAFDPALHKEVALKLWDGGLGTPLLERLLDEARVLAKFRHPNLLLVLGAAVHDGQAGMWTELLDGWSLEQWVERNGPVGWREAALIGIDLCRALAAVHALGVLHHDVKPANVLRARAGRIVLADFGSAGRYHSGRETGASPSLVGGTPLTMAPEVLEHDPGSPAADLYSLGVVLFYLVTGRYPLQAASLEKLRADLAAGPLPPLRTHEPEVAEAFAKVVDRALERAPADRYASAVAMERALDAALASDRAGPVPSGRRKWIGVAAAALVVTLLAVAWWRRPHPGPADAVDQDHVPMQFTVDLPAGEHLPQFANVVVSPDGNRIAFATVDSTGNSALWIRRFDSLSSARIPGTEGASYPFWSPDGREIAFFTDAGLKAAGVDGENVRVVCNVALGRGGAWNAKGTILFAPSTEGPIYRVPAAGGTPIPATTLDSTRGERSHRWPCFLPDGEHFLFVSTPESKGTFPLFVGSLHSDRRVFVGQVEAAAVYTSGMLVYMVNQGLEARPFDTATLRWSGDPHPISAFPGFGGAVAEPHATASMNGTLVYAFDAGRESRLIGIDLPGGAEHELAKGPYYEPSLSPDGRRIVAERVEGAGRSAVWMLDVQTGAAERWTEPVGLSLNPIWSPRGDSIVYSSNRSGFYQLIARGTDGALGDRILYSTRDGRPLWPDDWSPDGVVTFTHYIPGTNYDIFALRGGAVTPIVQTPEKENRCSQSADGRWLAFVTGRSGHSRLEVVDRRTHAPYLLATDGVYEPHWSRGSGDLFFSTTSRDIYAVTPGPGPPTQWPIRHVLRTGYIVGFDVDARGRRLVCCVQGTPNRPEEVAVLVNLPAAVKRGL